MPCLLRFVTRSFLAPLAFIPISLTPLYAADVNAESRPSSSVHRSLAEPQNLIDFSVLDGTSVFGHETFLPGVHTIRRARAKEPIGLMRTPDRPVTTRRSLLYAQDLAAAHCTDDHAGSLLTNDWAQFPSFEPASNWFAAKARAVVQTCGTSILVANQHQALTGVGNDVPASLQDYRHEKNDLLPFVADVSQELWGIQSDQTSAINAGDLLPVGLTERSTRRQFDDVVDQAFRTNKRDELRHEIGPPLARTIGQAPRLASLSWNDGGHLIAQAAFPHTSKSGVRESPDTAPLTVHTALRRPATVAPPILKDRQRTSTANGVVSSKVKWEIYPLPAEEPTRLTLLDAVPDDQEKPLIFDDGWILANGLKVPLGRLTWSRESKDPKGGTISLMPFVDTGTVWNTEIITYPVASDPFGIGAGIGWQITEDTDMRLGVDIPVVSNEADGDDESNQLGFQFRLATTLGD